MIKDGHNIMFLQPSVYTDSQLTDMLSKFVKINNSALLSYKSPSLLGFEVGRPHDRNNPRLGAILGAIISFLIIILSLALVFGIIFFIIK